MIAYIIVALWTSTAVASREEFPSLQACEAAAVDSRRMMADKKYVPLIFCARLVGK